LIVHFKGKGTRSEGEKVRRKSRETSLRVKEREVVELREGAPFNSKRRNQKESLPTTKGERSCSNGNQTVPASKGKGGSLWEKTTVSIRPAKAES